MIMDKVSILIVSYNAERFLEKTLKSCLQQTYQNIEILLLDNASSDGTTALAQAVAQQDSRLQVFHSKRNLGPYGGLNFLLEKATGQYIAIQDHDDIWLPEKTEKQVAFLDQHLEYIGCGTLTEYYFESQELFVCPSNSLDTLFVDHTSLLFRNKGFRYEAQHILADELFERKTLSKHGKLACLQSPLTIHRIKRDGGNLSSSRIRLKKSILRDYFSLHGYSFGSFKYLLITLIGPFFGEKVVWFVRRNLTLRDAEWQTKDEFQARHPDVDFYVA